VRIDPESPVSAAAEYLVSELGIPPGGAGLGIVLGSGHAEIAELTCATRTVGWGEVPGFQQTRMTAGHPGTFSYGELAGVGILFMAGRRHYYEGWSDIDMRLPIATICASGAKNLLFTNAAGGISEGARPGSMMVVRDHINLMFRSPLLGNVMSGATRFPDMSSPYDATMSNLLFDSARRAGASVFSGVYGAVSGPSYETKAEVTMLRELGVDAVGMSTIPEVLVAHALRARCAVLACITNCGTTLDAPPMSHDSVLTAGAAMRGVLQTVVRSFVEGLRAVNPNDRLGFRRSD